MEELKRLKDLGNQEYSNKNYDKALKHYSDAIKRFKGVSNDNTELAILHSNRCATYISMTISEDNREYLKAANLDATKSVELNKDWFRGHSRLAKVLYLQEDFKKSIKEYDLAIQLLNNTPSLELYKERDRCIKEGAMISPLRQALYYLDGANGYSQNIAQAYKLVTSAGFMGDNGIAMFYMDYCKLSLSKTKKEFAQNLQILERFAKIKEDPDQGPRFIVEARMISMFALGLIHYEPFISKMDGKSELHQPDYQIAQTWFEKSEKKGYIKAGYYLAKMHAEGKIKRCYHLSEKTLLDIESQGFDNDYYLVLIDKPDVILTLLSLYIQWERPESAIPWLDKYQIILNPQDKEKYSRVIYEQLKILEPVLKFEKENNLSSDDMSINDRLERAKHKTTSSNTTTSNNNTAINTTSVSNGNGSQNEIPDKKQKKKIEENSLKIEMVNEIREMIKKQFEKVEHQLSLDKLKPISLCDMKPGNTYPNTFIELTMVSDVFTDIYRLIFIGQDKDSNLQRVLFYNFDKKMPELKHGTKFIVINPSLRQELEKVMMVVENQESIIFSKSINDACAVCLKSKSKIHCENCDLLYCSLNCLEFDKNTNGHSVICYYKKKNNNK